MFDSDEFVPQSAEIKSLNWAPTTGQQSLNMLESTTPRGIGITVDGIGQIGNSNV
jgi:hypothetical protein